MKTVQFLVFIFFFLSSVNINADNADDIQLLNNLAARYETRYNENHSAALSAATNKGWPVRRERDDGTTIELQILLPSGKPLYYITHNGVAAKTISTNKVYSGGVAGLNLNGTGITFYEWDSGRVRTSHQEFESRVTIADTGNNTLSNHSTHVAGTMMAAGIDGTAKGMAYTALLMDYDWNNDVSEISAAGAAGALISNHSYGFIHGWDWNYFGDDKWTWFGDITIDPQEESWFGYYSTYSAEWDEIAYLAPQLLICKSAGNDRNDDGPDPGEQYWVYDGDWILSTEPRNPDGPWDCIGTKGICKNILTVGAVNDILIGYTEASQVVATSFSSWGPPDDGRIKPDITANGQHLYSPVSTADDSYSYMSGTSMSAPSAAGSIGLLQQHYASLHRTYMLAATAKALVIHTADEAGPDPGPDYMFGWGLMNTRTAADVISQEGNLSYIIEETLNDGGTYTLNVHATANEPLKATLCWTDIPGTPPPESLDPPDPMLVNDLDMRITKTGFTGYPWKLDKDNPANAATNNSDNSVDNVEQVLVSSPEQELYTITITHKGTLEDPQNFSLIVTGFAIDPPLITTNLDEMTVTMLTGTTENRFLRIFNEGVNDLTYYTDVNFLSRNSNTEILPYNNHDFTEIDNLQPEMSISPNVSLPEPEPLDLRDIELHYDGSYAGNGLGTAGSYWWTCAARFTADELASYYDSYYLKQIKIMVGYSGGEVLYSSVIARVWEGGSYGNPGNLVYSSDITGDCIPGVWTVHTLSSPVMLLSGNEYWLGYSVESISGYVSTMDDGPVVQDKGDWLDWGNGNNWYTISWNRNFKIRGIIAESWINIVANGSGTLPGSGRSYTDLEILLNSAGYPVATEKTAELVLISNDPYDPELAVPVTMSIVSAPPDPPLVINISVSGNDVLINWEPVAGAASYSVYSDTDPEGSFTTLEISGLISTNWTDFSAVPARKFYIVKTNI